MPKLTPSAPVTIDRSYDGLRWFPTIRRLRDGSLLLHVQTGHDLAFSPVARWRSFDLGQQWVMENSNVPRTPFCWQFSDGELFEIDNYGAHDPATPNDSVVIAAWSHPESRADKPRIGRARLLDAPNFKTPVWEWINGNPTMPWWPLWEDLHNTRPFHNEVLSKVFLNGYFFSDGFETEPGRLVAVAYGLFAGEPLKHNVTFLLESLDRGATWRRVGTITHMPPAGSAEKPGIGTNEAGIVKLNDGRLYCVMRAATDAPPHTLVHSWSSDDGKTWTPPTVLNLVDEPGHHPGLTWPRLIKVDSGALVLAYGRPGKNLVIDPSGTGTQWQGRLDLHQRELDTQAFLGVPESQRLRGVVGHMSDLFLDRYHDSTDYLAMTQISPDEILVFYDVQDYLETWNARPFSGVRMVKVKVG
jgi:hypothetical protein